MACVLPDLTTLAPHTREIRNPGLCPECGPVEGRGGPARANPVWGLRVESLSGRTSPGNHPLQGLQARWVLHRAAGSCWKHWGNVDKDTGRRRENGTAKEPLRSERCESRAAEVRRERDEQSVERPEWLWVPSVFHSRVRRTAERHRERPPASSCPSLCFLTGWHVIPGVFLRRETITRADIPLGLCVDRPFLLME